MFSWVYYIDKWFIVVKNYGKRDYTFIFFSSFFKLYLFINDYETSYTTYINHAGWHRFLRSDGLRVGVPGRNSPVWLGDQMTISHAEAGYRVPLSWWFHSDRTIKFTNNVTINLRKKITWYIWYYFSNVDLKLRNRVRQYR